MDDAELRSKVNGTVLSLERIKREATVMRDTAQSLLENARDMEDALALIRLELNERKGALLAGYFVPGRKRNRESATAQCGAEEE